MITGLFTRNHEPEPPAFHAVGERSAPRPGTPARRIFLFPSYTADVRPWLLIVPFLVACGGNSSPVSPTPAPPSNAVVATLTDSASGASLGTQTVTAAILPALIQFRAPGHHDRQAWITSRTPTVDLIPLAGGFDLAFYRAFARDSLEDAIQPRRVRRTAPSIYVQTTGMSAAYVSALEASARALVPALTGGRFQLQRWETGDAARAPADGWITVALFSDPANSCGRGVVGGEAGRAFRNTAERCRYHGEPVGTVDLFAHEIGHAMGFTHVTGFHLMNPTSGPGTPTATERFHAAIAYKRVPGNTDVDRDPDGGGTATLPRLMVD